MHTPHRRSLPSCTRAFLGAAVLAVVTLASPAFAAPSVETPRESLKLLTIGNSFAYDATAFLPKLAHDGGKSLQLFSANIGGASLARQVEAINAFVTSPETKQGRPYTNRVDPRTGEKRDFGLLEALEADAWDIVTIQQVSHLSFKSETYEPHARTLIEFIRKHAPTAEIVIHMTWAYREDHPIYQRGDGFTPQDMHAGLREAYLKLAADYGLRIIPAGEAFYNARQTPRWTFTPDATFDLKNPPAGEAPDQTGSLNPGWRWVKDAKTGEQKFAYDGFHANQDGRYLAACVWYETLFNDNVQELRYHPDTVSAENAADLRRIAHETVAAWKETTAPAIAR